MGLKATYHTDTRLLEITEAPVVPAGAVIAQQTIDVEIDLYSDGKEDWNANIGGNYRGNIFPWVTAVSAGQALPGGQAEPAFFRFRNDLGWRLLPFDSDHELTLLGNFVPFDEGLPVIAARPGRTILVFRDGSQVAQMRTEQVAEAVDQSSRVVELHRRGGLDYQNPWDISDVVANQDFNEQGGDVLIHTREIAPGITRLQRIVEGHALVPSGSVSVTGHVPTVLMV